MHQRDAFYISGRSVLSFVNLKWHRLMAIFKTGNGESGNRGIIEIKFKKLKSITASC